MAKELAENMQVSLVDSEKKIWVREDGFGEDRPNTCSFYPSWENLGKLLDMIVKGRSYPNAIVFS